MLALKNGTRAIHARLERRLSIKTRLATPNAYSKHLVRLLGFYVVAEARWAAPGAIALDDYDARRKAHLIAADLQALGLSPEAVGAVPLCDHVPEASDITSALGGLYVVEGATLGGQHLAPMANRSLGVSAERGASFLAAYGERSPAMWRRFGAAVESWCDTTAKIERAVGAARSVFLAIEDWLCGTEA